MSPHVKSLYDIIRVAVPQPGTCEDPNKSPCVHSPFSKVKLKSVFVHHSTSATHAAPLSMRIKADPRMNED